MAANARIEMRCEEEDKELLNRAAALRGMKTTEFIRELALEKARAVVEQAERMEVSASSYRRIIELLDNPPEPNEALRRALRAHRDSGL